MPRALHRSAYIHMSLFIGLLMSPVSGKLFNWINFKGVNADKNVWRKFNMKFYENGADIMENKSFDLGIINTAIIKAHFENSGS